MEKETQEEDEKNEKVREKGRGHREKGFNLPDLQYLLLIFIMFLPTLFLLRVIFTTYFFSYPKVN